MRLRNKKTGEIVELDLNVRISGYPNGIEFMKVSSLAELNEEWEDYEQKEEKPKRYRLKKDLPTFKAGDEFFTDPYGSLWLDQEIDGEPNSSRVMAYNHSTLEKFPNILEDWFEPIEPAEPLIKDEKIRKAVRAWAAANDVEKVDYWDSDYEFQGMQSGSSINFEDNPIETEDRYGNDEYTIAELCGEEEE